MSLLTVGSFVTAIVLIVISILLNGKLDDFIDWPSVMITIGGSLAAITMSFPAQKIKMALSAFNIAIGKQKSDNNAGIDLIIRMATVARKGGLLALENEIDGINNHFIKKGVMLIVDGSNSEMVKSVMMTEIDNIYARHGEVSDVYKRGAAYAPAFGMIGTLVGLINMLVMLSDPSAIGPAMAVALVTTFYGTVMANLIFTPLANKLDCLNSSEELCNRIYLEGLLSIQAGENPRIIKEKLEAFIPAYEIKKRAAEQPSASE